MAVPTLEVNSTISGGITLGSTWRHRMRGAEAPIDLAAWMYMSSRTDTTALRTMREPPMPISKPSVKTICVMPAPNTEATTISTTRPGKLIQASTKRWITRSTLPPK